MSKNNTAFVMDAGNTSLKVAMIDNGLLIETQRFSYDQMIDAKIWLDRHPKLPRILASVLSEEVNDRIKAQIDNVKRIVSSDSVPFAIQYLSPTLGIDRLCNAAFLHCKMKTLHSVAIDIGTCVKFDLMHRELGYLGGSIAPGIRLRYESLHVYTGNLPLLSNKNSVPLVGTSTDLSIQSGVINGMGAEIQGMIDRYAEQYPDLTFFMSGGDAGFFEFHSKNNIFADENLTLKGLFEIYKHNA